MSWSRQGPEAHPTSYTSRIGCYFPGGRTAEAWSWPVTSIWIMWISCYAHHVVILIRSSLMSTLHAGDWSTWRTGCVTTGVITSVPTEHSWRTCGVIPPPSWCLKKRRDDLGIPVLWGVWESPLKFAGTPGNAKLNFIICNTGKLLRQAVEPFDFDWSLTRECLSLSGA